MKKKFQIIKKATVYIAISIILLSVIFLIGSMIFFNDSHNSIFGYKVYIVLSDSMKKTDFAAGDLIFIKKAKFEELKVGDIISYTSLSHNSYGDVITHKIRSIVYDEYKNPGFITYGTTTGIDDEEVVTYPYIIGKYQFKIPKAGYFFQFLKTVPGYIIFVLIPFLTLILLQLIDTIKAYQKYKNEQLEELRYEKEQIIEERKKLEKKIEELQKAEKTKKISSKRKTRKKQVKGKRKKV